LSVAVLVRIFTGCDERNPHPLSANMPAKSKRVVLRK
jgi:hypothetical protein